MATRAKTADVLETGRAFADAYAAGDCSRVEVLLDPDVRYREITPSRMVDATGRAAILDEVREFLDRYDRHETLEVEAWQVGGRVGARTLWRLHRGEEIEVVEWCEYVTVRDGRITALDVVCSGPMPEQ
jgi:ketosteroid isomerase-like protein